MLIWELPSENIEVREFRQKRTKYCFITIVWNEGERIKVQLQKMALKAEEADIIVVDGDSDDGSIEAENLQKSGVRSLLRSKAPGLCTATRIAIAYAMEQGYEGIVTVDGNNKDGVEAISDFIAALDEGFDLVQGSRYLPGGHHENTPLERTLALRLLFSPILSLAGGYWFTDVTNGFRACSMRFLLNPRVQPIRKTFVSFNLQMYLVYRAAKLGMKVKEIPVIRVYPPDGQVPSKLVTWRKKAFCFFEMIFTALGFYNPRP